MSFAIVMIVAQATAYFGEGEEKKVYNIDTRSTTRKARRRSTRLRDISEGRYLIVDLLRPQFSAFRPKTKT